MNRPATTPICPACELGDHKNSAACESLFRCACPCHPQRVAAMATPLMRALQWEKAHRLPATRGSSQQQAAA